MDINFNNNLNLIRITSLKILIGEVVTGRESGYNTAHSTPGVTLMVGRRLPFSPIKIRSRR